MDNIEIHVLLVAGGKSSRMQSSIPKQFLPISGIPLLHHTFRAFEAIGDVKFTLVLPQDHVEYWRNSCDDNGFKTPHEIVIGGPTRFHSVKAGLQHIPDGVLVLIHDGARPFPSQKTIKRVINVAARKGNAIPAIELVDSIREVTGTHNKMLDRSMLKSIQTPQGFHSSLIKKAYVQPYNEAFTDDSVVLEKSREQINIVAGNGENIKVSKQLDLLIAQSIFEYSKNSN